jgi:hypothetical protein
MSVFMRAGVLTSAVALLPVLFSGGLFAQTVVDEIEPNDPCANAQLVEVDTLPFLVTGSFDSTEVHSDVDFYRINGTPGYEVTVTLEGQATGMGSVHDPYLGFFDDSCGLLAVNDDDGSTLNSRLVITVPDSGEYILGASVCCDYLFEGGGIGTYTLSAFEPTLIQSIAGRIIDADSLTALLGDDFPYASASLYRCNDFGCYQWVNAQPAGSDGTFLFTTDYMGFALTAGSYAVNVSAQWYESSWFGPYQVYEDEAADLGDLALVPMEMIGFITGRLIDAIHETPLPGNSPPFASVAIERCEEWGCYPLLSYIPTDDQGIFYVNGQAAGITPGTFRVVAYADEYYPLASDTFTLGDKESADLQNLPMTPLSIAFGEVTGCDVLPLGGTCRFSVQISNRGAGRYRGEAWALVRYFSQNFPYGMSSFQIGRVGAENPNPVRVNLGEDRMTTLEYKLDIPGVVSEGISLCVSVNIGRDPDPQFDTTGNHLLFCAVTQQDGELQRLSRKDSKRLLRQKYVMENGLDANAR